MTALIVFAGLPGTGKTTLSRLLGRQLGAAVLRVDVIEATVAHHGLAAHPVEVIGYDLARDLAADCLGVGTSVIVDAVSDGPRLLVDGADVVEAIAAIHRYLDLSPAWRP